MKDFAKLLQDDPIAALQAAGHDPDKVSESYMQKRIDDMKKSPEQRELEDLRAKVEEERKAREDLEAEKVTAEQARVQEEYSRHLDKEIDASLDSSDLPKSPYVVKRIAENLMIAIEQGNEDVTVQDILPLVEKQIKGEIRQMFEAMPEDIVEKVLGNDVSTKLRKRRLSKAKKAPATSKVAATGQSELKASKAKAAEDKKQVKAKDFWGNF